MVADDSVGDARIVAHRPRTGEPNAHRARPRADVQKGSPVGGDIVDILQFALEGVTQQQAAIANNLANAQTPGYTAETVSFQQSLEQALQRGGTAHITEAPSAAAPASDGNNVNLTTQLVEAEQSTLQYQAITDSLNAQFRLIQGSAGGSYA
jgi:flagellar basal-body rod protein FlgB